MNLLTLVSIAIGLAMDAFAVAITSGIILKQVKLKHAMKIGFFFGFFQGFMPLLGWTIGKGFYQYISHIDHWVAYILLTIIGFKMIYESFKYGENDSNFNPLQFKVLLLLAIATSIDALAVGISFAFLNTPIIISSIVIGLITFTLSFIGVLIGKNSSHLLKRKAELIGGLILSLIGVKILFEHLKINVDTVFNFLNF